MSGRKETIDAGRISEKETQLLVAVAERYHEFGRTQQEIADEFRISRPKVSRLLARAKEEGIVQIKVVNPFSHAREIREELLKRYGLLDALVIPSTVSDETLLTEKIGQAGAVYLAEHLVDGEIIGVGRGRTVYQVVRFLPEKSLPGLSVVPLTGGLGQADAYFQVNELARKAAERLSGRCVYLYAPAMLQHGTNKRALYSEPHLKRAVELWDRLDWAVVGIGAVESPHNAEYFKIMRYLIKTFGAQDAVGDICLWHFDAKGVIYAKGETLLISITPELLKRTKKVVAVAGSLKKVRAIRATLLGGLVNILITDERTADGLLQEN
ncbi:MAG: sugar-binding transcriptional regulator [Firmicutes bacterium]|nr:sugar-binding transcriptional regulator [Bacillota bacterium]MCL5040493.1 sugar-binding transcriptional regulator [Bacillota bacterium]